MVCGQEYEADDDDFHHNLLSLLLTAAIKFNLFIAQCLLSTTAYMAREVRHMMDNNEHLLTEQEERPRLRLSLALSSVFTSLRHSRTPLIINNLHHSFKHLANLPFSSVAWEGKEARADSGVGSGLR